MTQIEALAPSPTESPQLEEPLPFASKLAGAAGYITKLRRGERAILRRLRDSRENIPPEIFWRIVDRYQISADPDEETFWMVVLPLMVKYEHQPGARPGAVLARAGVSAARVERWLRLDRDAARRESSRLLSRIEGPIDWVALGYLLSFWSESDRRRFARDFFLSPEQRERSNASKGAA